MKGVIGEAQREMEQEQENSANAKQINGTASPATRPSLKSDSEFNKYPFWKQKLRDNCYKRVREDRTRLLWKMRLHLPASHHSHSCQQQQQEDQLELLLGEREDIVRAAFEDIVSDEFNKMSHSHSQSQMDDDLLWEYEGPPPHTTYQGDCQDILLEMQRIFYEDLKSQPPIQGLESEIETWEEEVDEYLARAVYEHMQLNTDKDEIWCPICKHGELKDSHNLIYCTLCELKLNKANELTLDFLRDRLAEVHIEHLDRGCRLKPKFCLTTKFNLTALYISCEACETFEVVI
ncbi:uncharacterized protein LOC130729065 isoform X1 [Lotus japonicus]|uniref:uncharacterized protein LOC130729065 isoform X1 n=1 Tax=Lotus japonicus TaxID=34305 RepID=UPI0025895218|nr:uncharacterized protein LOC130729065 isoform X1 [Lotus japonicus]